MVEIAKAIGADAKIVIMDEPTASLMDDEVDRLFSVIGMLRGAGRRHRLHLPSPRGSVRGQRSDHRAARRRDGRDAATTAAIDRVGADSDDGRARADRRVSEAAGRARGRRARAAAPVEPRARHPRRVAEREARRSARRRRPRRIGPDRAGGNAVRSGAGRRRRDPARTAQPVRIESPSQAIRLGIGYVPEDRRQHGVVLEMPIASNASLASLGAVSSRGLIDRAAERRSAEGYVERLRIKTPSVSTEVGALSGGNQQKVALARWLSIGPRDSDPRRADPGRGRRREGGDSRADPGAGRARARDHHDLVRAAGDPGHERSRRGDARRHGQRRPVARRGDAGQDHRARARSGPSPADRPPLTCGTASHARESSVACAIAALALVLAVAAPGYFSAENLSDLFLANLPVLLVALGMTLVIVTGEIDISVGSMFAICGVAAGVLAKAGRAGRGSRAPPPACWARSLGSLNGALVAYVGIPSIVVTLATMMALRDGLRWATEGAWVQDLPRAFSGSG